MGVRIAVRSLWAEGEPSTFVYEFDQTRVAIGRARSADIQLPHVAVSGAHATIRTAEPGYAVIDEGSTNGTRVNDRRVATGRPKTLATGDAIDIGGYRLVVHVGVPVGDPTSAKRTTAYALRLLEQERRGTSTGELATLLEGIESDTDRRVDPLPALPTPPPPNEPPPRPSSNPPRARRIALTKPHVETSELLVYSLAGLLLAASLAILFFLSA